MARVASIVSPERLDRFKYENRCLYCKKQSFEDKVTCGKCLEFEYCSVQCLELDRATHQNQCDIIGLKKGRRVKVSVSFLRAIERKAKLLDEEDNIRNEIEALKLLDAIRYVRPNGTTQTDERKRKTKNHKRKKKNNSKKNTDLKFDDRNIINKMSVPAILSTIVSGKFGGPTKCDSRELSGVGFGQGWWKARRQTAEVKIKSLGASLNTLHAHRSSKLKFKDFYPEFDENNEINSAVSIGINGSRETNCHTKDIPSGEVRNSSTVQESDHVNSEKKCPRLQMNIADSKEPDLRKRHQQSVGATAGPALQKCSFCSKESISLKLCTRCSLSRYCDQTCQRKDYSRHKERCKRERRLRQGIERFARAIEQSSLSENVQKIIKLVIPFKKSVILEINKADFFFFIYIAECMDSVGSLAIITFDLNAQTLFTGVTDHNQTLSAIQLKDCLNPGNFIILKDPQWIMHPLGIPCVIVTETDRVYFVFK